MKKGLFIIYYFFLNNLFGQSLKDFTYLNDPYNNEKFIPVSVKFANIKNTKVKVNAPGHNYNGWIFEIGYKTISFDKFKTSYDLTYKLIPEIFVPLNREINGKGAGLNRDESSSITTGLFGWHSLNWNIVSKQKFCLASGFNLNDFFFGVSARDSVNGGLITKEPHGWYWAAGPSIKIHYLINNAFILHSRFDYSLSYFKPFGISYGIDDPSDKKPNWYVFNTTLVSKWGAFLGIEYFGILYNGKYPNNTRRIDAHLGFNFVL